MADNYDSIMKKLDEIYEQIVLKNHYQYYNVNPKQRITDDCVIRSISAATGKSWDDVLKELTEYSLKYKYFINCEELYEIYLRDHSWVKHKKPLKKNGEEYKLGEWLETFRKESVVTIGDYHLTYVNNGTAYDIWNCTGEPVDVYWTKKKSKK